MIPSTTSPNRNRSTNDRRFLAVLTSSKYATGPPSIGASPADRSSSHVGGHFEPPAPESVAFAPRTDRLRLPTILDDVQLAAADREVDRPAEVIEEPLGPGDEGAVLLFESDVQDVEPDPVIADEVP